MNICLISDNNFVNYLSTLIVSILKNSNDEDRFHFHIIEVDITEENKSKIMQLKEIKECEISFYKSTNIEKYKKRLRWREKQITEKLGIVGLNVHIACGYAEYDNEKDEDFESTRSRADKKMYESKKMLKKDK